MVRGRARNDAGFGSWYSEQNRLRLGEESKEQAEAAGQTINPTASNRQSTTLIAFANDYRKMAMDDVRKAKSPSTNPLGYQLFNQQLEACFECGLL